MKKIHPTAILGPEVEVEDEVEIGPYAVVEGKVKIGRGTKIYAHARLQGPLTVGKNNQIFPYSSIGTDPQDVGYKGESTEIIIGDNNIIREFVTINRGTPKDKTRTVIGNNNYFMAYSHIAHDCIIGNNVIFTNGASIAGHVEVHDYAILSAFVGVQQFSRIGAHAFIGAYSVITQDVIPYSRVVGARPAEVVGVNTIGLVRRGFTREQIRNIDRAFRILLRSGLNLKDAIERIEKELGQHQEIQLLVDFLKTVDPRRGFHRKLRNSE